MANDTNSYDYGMFLARRGGNAYLYVDTETRTVTVKSGPIDMFYGTGGKRIIYTIDTVLFTMPDPNASPSVTANGAAVLYNPDSNSFTVGYNSSEGSIVGVTDGNKFYPNGDIIVKYSDGTRQSNSIENYNNKLAIDEKIAELKDRVFLPSYVEENAADTYSRLRTWAGDDDVFLIAQITDSHIPSQIGLYKHIKYLSELNKAFEFNVLIHSGDLALTASTVITEKDANTVLYNVKRGMNCTSPWLFTKGNHDSGDVGKSLTELGNIFNKPTSRRFPGVVFGDDTCLYGYMDFTEYKVRVYFLNTSENTSSGGYRFTNRQCQWLANTLATMKDDWKVVIGSHICPNNNIIVSNNSTTNFLAVLEGFVNKTSGISGNIFYDFTSVPSSAKLVTMLCGHEHFNNYEKHNGVNYVIRQGYGGGGMEHVGEISGCTCDRFDFNAQCLFDILAIKNDGNCKVFRIGAGGESRDLEFTY